ncbi:zinc finger protein 771-like isoform X2 [Maniola hyperantus]|uniref:zinc finger protein 771-like isoform X2 n=1 Tax=Aphantopus hyperantus TaxID=2795564 RepID=UPI002136CB1A
MENNYCVAENLDNVCRICFEMKTDSCSLFSKKGDCCIYEKLVTDAKLQFHINDGGPASICSQCLNELNVFAKFLDKCKKANEIFLQFKKNLKDTRHVDHSSNYSINNGAERKSTENTSNEKEDCIQAQAQDVDSQELKSSANKPASHTCQFCCKVFTRKFNYKLHLKRHSGECNWQCRACGAATPTRAAALRHCAPPPRKACPAPGCGKSFTSVTNLNTHIRKHNGERPYSCAQCGKTFGSSNTLADHTRIHTGAKPYMCWVCGKQFATNKLGAHLRTHAARALACPACPRRVASARALRLHARTHAPPARVHACAACPARYCHKQSLNKHLRNAHGLKTS